jgi:hypothetical protein
MLIPYNDTACIVCVITGRGTVTSYTLILRTLSRCTPPGRSRKLVFDISLWNFILEHRLVV